MNEQRAALAGSIAASFGAACHEMGRAPAPLPSAPAASGNGDTVQCLGIHECKGKSAYPAAGGHACEALNECTAKGWLSVTRAECASRAGKVLEG